MNPFSRLASLKLEVDHAAIVVVGPWAALAHFLASASTGGERWRVGFASADRLEAVGSFCEGAGRSELLFTGECPMGLGLGALLNFSEKRPALGFACACHDASEGLEFHWMHGGMSHSGALSDLGFFISLAAAREPQWMQDDVSTWRALFEESAPNLVSSWIGLDASTELTPWAAREGLLALSGDKRSDSEAWCSWPENMGSAWMWAPAPWSATPFWGMDPTDGYELLGRMCADAASKPVDRHASAQRALSIANGVELRDPKLASTCLARALASSEGACGNESWLWALGETARVPGCRAFGRGLDLAGKTLAALAPMSSLVELALMHPDRVRALLVGCTSPWGYSDVELERLCDAPAEVSSLAEARLFSRVAVNSEESKTGRSRL